MSGLAVSKGGTGADTALGARKKLGLELGVDVARQGSGGSFSGVYADLTGIPATFTPAAHNQAASTISDSTVVGRSVLTAVDAAAARTAIGAGTSSFDGVYSSLTSIPATFAPIIGATASTAVAGNDARLTDSRTPTVHATSHKSGGSDAIKLDELAAPTDVMTLNASTTAHGLMQKYPGGTANFLREDGTFASPGASSFSATKVSVTLPFPAKHSHEVTVTDASVTALSDIVLSLAGVAETAENSSDTIDVLGLMAFAAAGSFKLQASFMTPIAGTLSINYALG